MLKNSKDLMEELEKADEMAAKNATGKHPIWDSFFKKEDSLEMVENSVHPLESMYGEEEAPLTSLALTGISLLGFVVTVLLLTARLF